MFLIILHVINPIAVSIGPIAIRWYAILYIVGIFGAWWYIRFLTHHFFQETPIITDHEIEDFITWSTVSIIIGGRIGYILFYRPLYFYTNPTETLLLWHGGMSFHGGVLGIVVATMLFAKKHAISILGLGDLLGCTAPVGLAFGRIGNFINGELYGRVTQLDLPWMMIFQNAGPWPRHPSQIYESLTEGILLLVILNILWRIRIIRTRHGILMSFFLMGYGIIRISVELLREPDTHIGLLAFNTTIGQWLSIPMIIIGFYLLWKVSYQTKWP